LDAPLDTIGEVHEVVTAIRSGSTDEARLLQALTALRLLRDEMATWEPELIAAARAQGTSWAALAPALGVTSRQAAERRYLRLKPSATGEVTGEARVEAERDRRAGDRAVADWARQNSAGLRKLAGAISALDELDATAQETADRVGDALGHDDAARLLPPLAAARPHLVENHSELADQVTAITEHTEQIRREVTKRRHGS
jgi:hypothetical protein